MQSKFTPHFCPYFLLLSTQGNWYTSLIHNDGAESERDDYQYSFVLWTVYELSLCLDSSGNLFQNHMNFALIEYLSCCLSLIVTYTFIDVNIIVNDNFIKSAHFFFGRTSFFFCLWLCYFAMKSAAFFLSSSEDRILSYSSLSSKSSKVKREGWVTPVLWVWGDISMLGFESLLKVSTIETALC